MKFNVEKLSEIIRKATFGYQIDTFCIEVTSDNIIVNMKQPDESIVVCLNYPNDGIICDVAEPFELCLDNPIEKIKPFLANLDSTEAELMLAPPKIDIVDGSLKAKIFMCPKELVSCFNAGDYDIEGSPFIEFPYSSSLDSTFQKIKKIGARFKKVYFSSDKNGVFSIETTDKTNRVSNGMKMELTKCGRKNITIMIDFKQFISLTNIIKPDENFIIKFYWDDSSESGMILFEKLDGSEKYYIMQKMDS